MKTTLTENVLVIPRVQIDKLGLVQGYNETPEMNFRRLLLPDLCSFSPRCEELENDETQMQVIPYVIVTRGTAVLTYRRLKGDKRLLGDHSIGFGGHMNDTDVSFDAGVDREIWQEELYLPLNRPAIHYRGLILDDSNPVGRVHLGVVMHTQIPNTSIDPVTNEKAKIGLVGFLGQEQLWEFAKPRYIKDWPFESWSHICMSNLWHIFGRTVLQPIVE